MRVVAAILAALLTASLAGCMLKQAPTYEEQVRAESAGLHGPYPENYEEVVKRYLNNALFDPYSVRDLQIDTPTKGFIFSRGGPFAKDLCCYGWCVTVSFNAKNRMGAYTGTQCSTYFIKDGVCYFGENVPRETIQRLGSRRYE